MSTPAFVWPGIWGDTGRKIGVDYVKPIYGASHHWAVDQLSVGPIRAWRDRIGTSDFLAPSPDSQRPEVYESARKVVRFNGVNQRMDVAHPNPGPCTMFVVGRFGSSATSTYMLTGGTGPAWNFYIGGNGNFAFHAGATLSTSKPGDTSNHVFIVVSNGTNSVLRIDGTEWAGNAGTNVPTFLRLGATSSAYASVDFQTIGFLPYAADSVERTALHSQLKSWYSL